MPIRPFLAGRAFDPELINEMSTALQRACEQMRLREGGNLMTELVAEKIIELVERGVAGADALSAAAVKEMTGRD